MALTKVSTDGVKDDAITSGKIPANQIEASELADNAVDTNAIADQAVALSKLPHGTSSNNGKFLRANNGADPTFETVTSTTINNNADNRVITGSGTANTLEGEANLTFDGDELQIHHATDPEIHLNINSHGDVGQIKGDADGLHLTGNGSSNQIRLKTNNTERLRIQSNGDVYLNPTQGSTGVNSGAIRRFNAGLDYWSGTAGSANAIKYAAHGQSDDNMYGMGISNSLLELQSQVDIGFFCGSAGCLTGRRVERFRMKSDGNLEIADGNLIIGTNGHGIDFSATGDASGATSEKLDDYEEGTWTPQFVYWNGSAWVNVAFSNTPVTTNAGIYTKIGNIVHVAYYSENFLVTTGATGAAGIQGLPYQNSSTWTAFPISHADCFGNDAENGAVNASDYRLRFFTEDGITNATWSTSLGHIMLSATYRVA